MAGKIITNSIQLGDSTTDSQNFLLTTNIDGTAKLSRGATGNLGDILTINSTGVVNLPVNIIPAFSAYQSTTQTVTNSTWTKANLQTKEFDTTLSFDNVTNNRFQPAIAGYYQINGSVCGGVSGAFFGVVALYKNGTTYKQGNYSNNGNGAVMTVTSLVYLNGSTDYIELFAYVSGTTPNIVSGINITYLNGCLMARG